MKHGNPSENPGAICHRPHTSVFPTTSRLLVVERSSCQCEVLKSLHIPECIGNSGRDQLG